MPEENFEFKTLIYKGELYSIAGWVEEYLNLETGGQLFGFWTDSGFPIIQVAIGPGPNSSHEATSFYQDSDYLKKAGEYLNRVHGLQHIGEWHSHHRMSLNTPSGGDSRTMSRALERRNLSRFLLCIANIYPATKKKNSLLSAFTNEKKWTIKIQCFLYTQLRSGYQTGAWVRVVQFSILRTL